MRFIVLLVLVLAISLATRDQVGRRRARREPTSKYDLNPVLNVASRRTRREARAEQRRREELFGWDDEADDGGEAVSEPDLEEPPDLGRTVVVASFHDPAQAYLLRGLLASSGVPAVVARPVHHPERLSPGHTVSVREEDAEEALDRIREVRSTWRENRDQ